MVRSVVVAGGAGFIGSHFARLLLRRGYERVRIFDKLTYAGNPENFADLVDLPSFSFVRGDICDPDAVRSALCGFDAVVNFAAETHVDRSLHEPGSFITTDVYGVWVLLETVRALDLARFVQVSTDEVYGEVLAGSMREDAPLAPRNPYAASKAGGELMIRAYVETHRVPAIITRGSNTYGSYQYPEKFLPLAITNVLSGKPIPVYGDGRQRREWLHARDHAAAIEHVLRLGQDGEIYNVGSGLELENIDLATRVLDELGAGTDMIEFVADRPGHDRRYALDCTKLLDIGWEPRVPIEAGVAETVRWYVERRDWWERIKTSTAFLDFHSRNYGDRQRAFPAVAAQ
jgi:dTDP-glucose 4,6-dehydratase